MKYSFLIVPFAALIIAQIIKVGIDAYHGKFSWKDLDSYGGMPSSHAAFIAAALTKSFFLFGLVSPIFGLVAFLGFVVLRDAVGIRQEIGKQASLINQLIIDLPDALEDKYPRLETRIGHTHIQILAGAAIGVILAIIL